MQPASYARVWCLCDARQPTAVRASPLSKAAATHCTHLPPGVAQDVARLRQEVSRLELATARAGAAAQQEVDTAVGAVRSRQGALRLCGRQAQANRKRESRAAAAPVAASLAGRHDPHGRPVFARPQVSDVGQQLAKARADAQRLRDEAEAARAER